MIQTKPEFSIIYSENWDFIFRFVLNNIRNQAIAEDITQDVFLKAMKAWDRWDPIRPVRSWLIVIARNTIISHIRAKKNNEVELEDRFSVNGEAYDKVLDRELVSDLLFALNPRQLQVVLMHYYQDMTQTQIATKLGIPMGTVASRRHKGLKNIRIYLGLDT